MTRVGLEKFSFKNKKISVSYSDGTKREDGTHMTHTWYSYGMPKEDGMNMVHRWYMDGIQKEDGTRMVQRDKKVQNAK